MVMSNFSASEVDQQERTMLASTGGLTSAAAAVAYAGALPLITGAILAWARPGDMGVDILGWMALYGVVLLAFFGGVRWGVAIMTQGGPTFLGLIGSVIPTLLALGLFNVEDTQIRLGALVVAIPVLLLDDLRATKRGSGAPAWYLGVRIPITIMMEIALLAALALTFTDRLGVAA